jgi:hypothetical protein
VILRCNSDGDLYTVPPIAHDLVATSSSLWHRRLGHPSPAAIASLKKNNLISCDKVDHSLCHSCQLGKHVRLPFSAPTSQTDSPFEIVHCDVWTSPVASILVALITWFCWMISRIFVGPFHLGVNQRCINSWLLLFDTFTHSSAFLLNVFMHITGLPNAWFVPLTTLCTPFSSVQPCHRHTGPRPSLQPHTFSTAAPPLPSAVRSSTLASTTPLIDEGWCPC